MIKTEASVEPIVVFTLKTRRRADVIPPESNNDTTVVFSDARTDWNDILMRLENVENKTQTKDKRR